MVTESGGRGEINVLKLCIETRTLELLLLQPRKPESKRFLDSPQSLTRSILPFANIPWGTVTSLPSIVNVTSALRDDVDANVLRAINQELSIRPQYTTSLRTSTGR